MPRVPAMPRFQCRQCPRILCGRNLRLTTTCDLYLSKGRAGVGPLTWGGGAQYLMSILRNGNVTCLCRLFSPMSHVIFKKRLCPMSL